MKTRTWILILAAAALVFGIVGTVLLLPGEASSQVEIYSQGTLLKTLSLSEDQQFTVPAPQGGENTISIQDGKIAVIAATCPDHYCILRGYCNSGAPIICLPNALEIRFLGDAQPDISIR